MNWLNHSTPNCRTHALKVRVPVTIDHHCLNYPVLKTIIDALTTVTCWSTKDTFLIHCWYNDILIWISICIWLQMTSIWRKFDIGETFFAVSDWLIPNYAIIVNLNDSDPRRVESIGQAQNPFLECNLNILWDKGETKQWIFFDGWNKLVCLFIWINS